MSLASASPLDTRLSVSWLLDTEIVEHPVSTILVNVRQKYGGLCTNRSYAMRVWQEEHSSLSSVGTTSNWVFVWGFQCDTFCVVLLCCCWECTSVSAYQPQCQASRYHLHFYFKKKPIELQFIADDIFNFDIAFSYANLALSFASWAFQPEVWQNRYDWPTL